MTQQGDVDLFQTNDGGNILVENGLVQMSGGLATAAYLSLFGGNEEDDGLDGNVFTYWANRLETDPIRMYRSETQFLLRSLPATSANLLAVEAAAQRDLAWFVTVRAAREIRVVASIPALNRLRILIDIDGDTTLEFTENWEAEL